MIGVRSGTSSSRGVRAVSWKRRRASVASGLRARAVMAVSPFWSRSLCEAAAGEAEVDVVESRPAGAHCAGDPELVNGCDRLAARVTVQRHGEGRADREGALVGDATVSEGGERHRGIAV